MMFTATAFTNPASTAFGTYLTSEPSPAIPAASMITPVRTVSVASVGTASGPDPSPGMSAMITAIAPVACTDISTELVARAPARVPKR